jgi:hypothetical protein
MQVQRIKPGFCRPRNYLHVIGQRYPKAWEWVDQLRSRRGKDLENWPDWCYVPMAGCNGIVCKAVGMSLDQLKVYAPERLNESTALASLAAWRMTQGIYRIDPTLCDALFKSKLTGDIPQEILFRMPEWCIYIETPGLSFGPGTPIFGAFVHLEWDMPYGRNLLHIVLDLDNKAGSAMIGFALPLGDWSLSESMNMMVKNSDSVKERGYRPPQGLSELMQESIEPILSLLLYICTQASEINSGTRRPGNPQPKNTKRGPRIFQAEKPTTWDVGVRLGAALRRAYQAASDQLGPGSHTSPKPHVRVAHWHGFRHGPRRNSDGTPIPAHKREIDVRWLPPIPVNVDDVNELPAVIKPVV